MARLLLEPHAMRAARAFLFTTLLASSLSATPAAAVEGDPPSADGGTDSYPPRTPPIAATPARAAIGADAGVVLGGGCASIGLQGGVFAQFPVNPYVRLGGYAMVLKAGETCEYSDTATGVGAGATGEAHFLEGWFDPYFGIDLGLSTFYVEDGYEGTSSQATAVDFGGRIGIDVRIGRLAVGPYFSAHQVLNDAQRIVFTRVAILPLLRVSVQLY